MGLIAFRPQQTGLVNVGPAYTTKGMWRSADKVRFRNGLPEKIGGWRPYTQEPFEGLARTLIQWVDLDGIKYTGVGTSYYYYVFHDGELQNITPFRQSGSLVNNPLSMNLPLASPLAEPGDTVGISNAYDIDITKSNHGLRVGDTVRLTGLTGVSNVISSNTVNDTHDVSYIVSDNVFRIAVPASAILGGLGSVHTFGGSGGTYGFYIPPGATVVKGGWDIGTYGTGAYGEEQTFDVRSKLRFWSQTAFGEDLYINPRGGKIYRWEPGSDTEAQPLEDDELVPEDSQVPLLANFIMSSPEDRRLFAFGTTELSDVEVEAAEIDPLLIRWSDVNDPYQWTPGPNDTGISTAGEIRLSTGTEILTATRCKSETLVFTDSSLHALSFIGGQAAYGTRLLGTGVDLVGPNAVISVGDLCIWMGKRSFYTYSGQVKPIPCQVAHEVFSNINPDHYHKITVGLNSNFNEVWWLYPSLGSSEPDRYVVFNYAEQSWYFGSIERTAYLDRGQASEVPIAAGTDGYLYSHEVGHDAVSIIDGVETTEAIEAFVESSGIELGEGDKFLFISRVIPDLTFDGSPQGRAYISLSPRRYPGNPFDTADTGDMVRFLEVPVETYTEKVDCRVRGREFWFRVYSNDLGVAWRLGTPRFDVKPDGRR